MNNSSEETSELARRGEELLKADNFNDAIKVYQELLTVDTRNVNGWTNKGFAEWSAGDYESALKSLDSALALDPNNAVALLNKGNSLVELERSDEALACYNRALEIDLLARNSTWTLSSSRRPGTKVVTSASTCAGSGLRKACFENALGLGVGEAREMIQRCDQILMNDFYG